MAWCIRCLAKRKRRRTKRMLAAVFLVCFLAVQSVNSFHHVPTPKHVHLLELRACPFSSLFHPATDGIENSEHSETSSLLLDQNSRLSSRSIGSEQSMDLRPMKGIGKLALEKIDFWYESALAIKCPFFRRRFTDVIDSLHLLVATLMLNEDLVVPSLRCNGKQCIKQFGLSLEELIQVIRSDWKETTCRGYYVTGKLSQFIYRDDCLFDGPDPDMPVRGLRKYLNAASQLFDQHCTRSELLSLRIEGELIVAKWCFNGTMRLPWRPKIPQVTGTTTYHVDPSGLIYKHVETWDVSAFHAFVGTFWPAIEAKLRHLRL